MEQVTQVDKVRTRSGCNKGGVVIRSLKYIEQTPLPPTSDCTPRDEGQLAELELPHLPAACLERGPA